MKPRYAFFDFDGTLTRSDSLLPFLSTLNGMKFYWQLLKLFPVLAAYQLKMLSNEKAKEKVLITTLGGSKINDLQNRANRFALTALSDRLRTEGMEKLRFHQQQGDCCILVSASLELYLEPWAAQQGFNAVIGTQLEILNDCYTGEIKGKNCYGKEKIRRIESLYGHRCWEESYAYSDSLADKPLLEKAHYAYILTRGQFVRYPQNLSGIPL